MFDQLLSLVLVLPLSGVLLLLLISDIQLVKSIALAISSITFILSLFLWILFDNSSADMQFSFSLNWLIPIKFGVDGISLFLVLLTTFLIPVCILTSWNSIT